MHRRGRLLGVLVIVLCLFLVLLLPLVLHLNQKIIDKFEGNRWELPARVYARPVDLFAGMPITAASLSKQLQALGFVKDRQVDQPGEFSQGPDSIRMQSRGFPFPDEYQPSQVVDLRFRNGKIASIRSVREAEELPIFRLEPVRIANIYPRHNEDRVLVQLQEVPPLLLHTLLAVEDQKFNSHWGVRPKSIIRAAIANLRAGRTVQGGSTLTQQLVKNFFLTSERSLQRKINEAIMALLLEWHYEKGEILQAYLNEVYMGQDGNRAIHGFGLASQFYFQRDLQELDEVQIALLVGLVKGASYFNPRRFPDRAMERRNLVLDAAVKNEILPPELVAELKQKPLNITPKAPSGVTAYPAFLELVRTQLLQDYREEDLQNEGLIIFTTFDTSMQAQLEQSVSSGITKIEQDRQFETGSLQAAMMIASVEQGEILAMTGGRDARFAGFNRALNMRRQIGSVVKPAVYLTALAQSQRYHLLSLLDDSELSLQDGEWEPQNYDQTYHGFTTLLNALIHSYNVATVRLGQELGVEEVLQTLKKLGVKTELQPYLSVMLGAVELTPIEVLQMYQTIAAEGYKTPLRSILSVMDQQGQTLQRYSLEVDQVVPGSAVFLLTTILHEVTVNGTGRALQYLLPSSLQVAGKTGTTNDLRDSWFAGFSGEHVAVSWVGRDDYQPTGLTGSSGALRLFADVFAGLDTQSLQPLHPDDVEWALGDPQSGYLAEAHCGGVWIPFITDSPRPEYRDCVTLTEETIQSQEFQGTPPPAQQNENFDRLRELFQRWLN